MRLNKISLNTYFETKKALNIKHYNMAIKCISDQTMDFCNNKNIFQSEYFKFNRLFKL